MPRSVLSYVVALCLMIASSTHSFAFHFSGSSLERVYVTAGLQPATELHSASSLRSMIAFKPAGCSDVLAAKSLFAVQKMWAIASITGVKDHQRCHAGISPVVEHAGISPAAEFVGSTGVGMQSLLLTGYTSGFKDWRFKPPLRPPQAV